MFGSMLFFLLLSMMLGYVTCDTLQVNSNFIDNCDYYLVSSKYLSYNGRGIVSGKSYTPNKVLDEHGLNIIEKQSAITINCDASIEWPTHNYVFASHEEDQCMLVFGISMLMNHYDYDERYLNSAHHWYGSPVATQEQLYSHFNVQTQIAQHYTEYIEIGDEIFTSYGEPQWFSDREIEFSSRPYIPSIHRYSPMLLRANGVCMSNVYPKNSSLYTVSLQSPFVGGGSAGPNSDMDRNTLDTASINTFDEVGQSSERCNNDEFHTCSERTDMQTDEIPVDSGQGLYTAVFIPKGGVVTVSPVMIIPLHELVQLADNSSLLVNYCFVYGNSYSDITDSTATDQAPSEHETGYYKKAGYTDVALFAFTSGALMNHRPRVHRSHSGAVFNFPDDELANVEIDWYNFNNYTEENAHESAFNSDGPAVNTTMPTATLDTLRDKKYIQVDIVYRATRDIYMHEELFLDYGVQWEKAFLKYLVDTREVDIDQTIPVQFKYPMGFPGDRFPTQWQDVECIGRSCV